MQRGQVVALLDRCGDGLARLVNLARVELLLRLRAETDCSSSVAAASGQPGKQDESGETTNAYQGY